MPVAYVDDPGHMGHTLKALIESRGDGLGVDNEGGKIEILSSRLVAQMTISNPHYHARSVTGKQWIAS